MQIVIQKLQPFGVCVAADQDKLSIDVVDVEQLKELLDEHQLILLRGFDPELDINRFVDFCERWGEVSVWPFGKVLELIEHDNPSDHIFDHSYVPLHWDGMYRLQVPQYQLFHCVSAPMPGQGGRTTFSNTMLALEHASHADVALWRQVTGVYKRQMEFYQSVTEASVIDKHPCKHYPVIRYSEPPSEAKGRFINHPSMQFQGISNKDLNTFHHSLQTALYHSDHFYAHTWQRGDIVIADNYSLLHGREGFVSKAPRHIRRVHVLSNPAYDNPGLRSYQ